LHKILSPEYVIFTAKSGGEGLQRAASERPDFILLDIIMPGINGFEVLKTLKGDPDLKDIPIIIITGLDNEEDEEKGLLMGAVDYIFKPFKNTIILARVRTHIQIVQYIRMIEHLNRMDPLTGIPNRRCFDERMIIEWKRAVRENKPVSLMMIDMDKFKNYNDTYGHPQGDALLQAISKFFVSIARRPLDVAAQLGGEEFGILLPDTPADIANALAEKVQVRVENTSIPPWQTEAPLRQSPSAEALPLWFPQSYPKQRTLSPVPTRISIPPRKLAATGYIWSNHGKSGGIQARNGQAKPRKLHDNGVYFASRRRSSHTRGVSWPMAQKPTERTPIVRYMERRVAREYSSS
jgi:diguanylate cyclase (GGDEF)-like protein